MFPESQAPSAAATPRIAPHVAMASDDAGFMLVDLKTERYYGLNATGGRVCRLLGDGESVETMVDIIASEYGVEKGPCRRDIEQLLGKLAAWGMIVW